MIRIIAGEAKGRRLFGPKGNAFRPATGRVREFIFSYLRETVEEGCLLDMFSGTGSIGLEALSRGAPFVVFVEQSSGHMAILKRNITCCGFFERTRVIRGDVFSILKKRLLPEGSCRIAIADPPFKMAYRERIVRAVEKSRILIKEGLLLIEHDQDDADRGDHGMTLIKQRKFGRSFVSIYRA